MTTGIFSNEITSDDLPDDPDDLEDNTDDEPEEEVQD